MVTPDGTVWRYETWSMVYVLFGRSTSLVWHILLVSILSHVEDPILTVCILPWVRQSEGSRTVINLEDTSPLCL